MLARPKGSKNKPKYPEHLKYREDWVEEWLMEIAGNRTMYEVYEADPERFPHPSTVGKWLVKHEDFYDRYMKARRAGAEVDADYIRHIADNCSTESAAEVQKARLQVDTRIKIISKLLPGVYGDKVQIDTTVDDKRQGLESDELKSKLGQIERQFSGSDSNGEQADSDAPVTH